jgi:hypothetical protein
MALNMICHQYKQRAEMATAHMWKIQGVYVGSGSNSHAGSTASRFLRYTTTKNKE